MQSYLREVDRFNYVCLRITVVCLAACLEKIFCDVYENVNKYG
jgi:hypothetical protein